MLSKRVIKNERKTLQYLNHKIAYIIAGFILGGVFIYASIDKISFPKEFTKIVLNYHILPIKMATYFAFLLPWVELFLGIFLIRGLFVSESALVLSSLLFSFMIAIAIKTLNGTIENCGCFSTSISASKYNVFLLLFRDALFLCCGLLLIFQKKLKLIKESRIRCL